MTTIDETKELPTLIKGKKLEQVDGSVSTLSQCLVALAGGYVLECQTGFHFLDGETFAYVDKRDHITCGGNDFLFQPFIAAYRLVDFPWWENIPDEGIFIRNKDRPDVVQRCFKNHMSFVSDKVYMNGAYATKWEPVTDEWLESMKRGY